MIVPVSHWQNIIINKKTLFSDARLSFMMLQINSATSLLLHPMAINNFYPMRTKLMRCTSDSFCLVKCMNYRFHKCLKHYLSYFIITLNEIKCLLKPTKHDNTNCMLSFSSCAF